MDFQPRQRRSTEWPRRRLIVDKNAVACGVVERGDHCKDKDTMCLPRRLRRAGSSAHNFASLCGDRADSATLTWKDNKHSFGGSNILGTLKLLSRTISADFCNNGLPWEGTVCRSKMAGLSGILYALPVLVATGHPYDQRMWTVQAFLSIVADYFYIGQDSVWHGVDRYFAIFNILTIVWRAYVGVSWQIAMLCIFPVSCYLGANRAKNHLDVQAWHVWHCLWHVTGGPLACLVVYMLHHCPNAVFPLQAWCKGNL